MYVCTYVRMYVCMCVLARRSSVGFLVEHSFSVVLGKGAKITE